MDRRIITILGSTGSIGTQALDVVNKHPDLFELDTLIAGSNVDLLALQALRYRPKHVVIAHEDRFSQLKDALDNTGIKVGAGEKAVLDAMRRPSTQMVLTSTVGYSGLIPTLEAIKAGKDIALANKETLVVAGELVMEEAKKSNVNIYPVDSEHSAIYQCLTGEKNKTVNRIIITASGGPFRTLEASRLKSVTAADALKHPNWSMGNKITIDSATMMNKAFEIIEASWLFNVPVDRIEPVVHPQSIVHSMVEFIDGCIKAQLGVPDMRLPIKLALFRGERISAEDPNEYLKPVDFASLTFEKPDFEKFPCLGFAKYAMEHRGNSACIINAANEVAVASFLRDRIRFTDIPDIITETLMRIEYIALPTLDDYIATNAAARKTAMELISHYKLD